MAVVHEKYIFRKIYIITWKNSSANGNNIQSIFIAKANSEVKHKLTSRVKSWKCVEESTRSSIYPKHRAQPVKKPRTICRANIQTHN